tara:strand:+ start:74 stop:376 length:303 start_codon:yes stop_codon:yes gene_type:complete
MKLGGKSEIIRIGVSIDALFLESEQLWSHETFTAIGVETDQPRKRIFINSLDCQITRVLMLSELRDKFENWTFAIYFLRKSNLFSDRQLFSGGDDTFSKT